MKEIKKDILWRVYVSFFAIVLFAVLVIFQLVNIQVFQKEELQALNFIQNSGYKEVEPVRGNIYAKDGELLATSMLYYDIRMDLKADGLTDEIFNQNVDSLCYQLSHFFKHKSSLEFKQELIQARKKGSRWHLIARNVSYPDMRKLKSFPMYRLGKNKSGLICEQKVIRKRPFGILAERTLGKKKPTGLEGAYDKELRGEFGYQFRRRLPGGDWMPLDDENTVEPIDGGDIYSTIDVTLQDVAENALLHYLKKYEAEHGCVVLMECQTGAIRAIANLKVDSLGKASEAINYALKSSEPGSTFKLASLMAALEDGLIQMDDKTDTENGVVRFYDVPIRDSKLGGYGVVDVKEAFMYSSNTAVSKLITKGYNNQKQKFLDRLYRFGLHKKLDVEIIGEGEPLIKNVDSWSGISLPFMSIGYELHLTPMQILAFYNAVANDGKFVKPKFVEKIVKNGKTEIKETEIINPSICSKETIQKAKIMLEAVVENGTAKNLKNDRYKIAGKTGTTQLNYWKGDNDMSYKASFVGYFPADEPAYSCIVVVSTKSRQSYYGSHVAGPIFRAVADKVYASTINLKRPINPSNQKVEMALPTLAMNKNDFNELSKFYGFPEKSMDASYVQTNGNKANPINIPLKSVPNVQGMGLKDALYLLENQGLKVLVSGSGKVKSQSISPGEKVNQGQIIKISLS